MGVEKAREIKCPECKAAITVPPRATGFYRGRCAACGKAVKVHTAQAKAVKPEPSAKVEDPPAGPEG